MFQSTHPQGVRRAAILRIIRSLLFQSTHPQGVRLLNFSQGAKQILFQSTHPQGVRPILHDKLARCKIVSIHAPAGGATPDHYGLIKPGYWFQSTHPQGVRPKRHP